jgi:peptidoglycan/LPS O-acetylase OafA/YrhL
MLSGALTLRWRQESLWSFYIRRIIHVLVPMLIYYACYVAAHTWFGQSEAQTENGYLLDFIQGKAAIAPHFWLIYVILSVYLVVPFLRSMLHSLEYAKLTALVILVVFFLAIQTFAPMQPGIELYMASWPGVAIAGYWVSQPQTRRYDRYLYGCGIVAAAVICWMVYCDMDFMQYCCNLSPVSVALGLAVFAVIFHYEKYFSVRRGWISMLGKYSYSIILIHWGILGIVASWEGLAQLQWPVRAVLVTVLTLAVSLVCSMVLDQLLVGPLMRWLERWITVKNKNENERGTV